MHVCYYIEGSLAQLEASMVVVWWYQCLTHYGLVMPIRYQAITWTNAELLTRWPIGAEYSTNIFNEENEHRNLIFKMVTMLFNVLKLKMINIVSADALQQQMNSWDNFILIPRSWSWLFYMHISTSVEFQIYWADGIIWMGLIRSHVISWSVMGWLIVA